jgi:hypothetical protein
MWQPRRLAYIRYAIDAIKSTDLVLPCQSYIAAIPLPAPFALQPFYGKQANYACIEPRSIDAQPSTDISCLCEPRTFNTLLTDAQMLCVALTSGCLRPARPGCPTHRCRWRKNSHTTLQCCLTKVDSAASGGVDLGSAAKLCSLASEPLSD